MQESFDPYSQWLGIQDGRRPANHYELLRIELYESDPGVIAHAADVVTARIRGIRPGQHAAAWQQLLDALREAKRCLLDPTAKATYDAALRGQAGPGEPAAPAPMWSAPYASTGVEPQEPSHAPPDPYAQGGVPTHASSDPNAQAGTPAQAGSGQPLEATPAPAHDGSVDELAAFRVRPRRKVRARLPVAHITVGLVTIGLVVVAAVLVAKLRDRGQDVAANQPSPSQPDSGPSAAGPEGPSRPPGPPTPPAPQAPSAPQKLPAPSPDPKSPGKEQPSPKEKPKPEEKPKPPAPPAPPHKPEKAPPAPGPKPISPAEAQRQEALKRAIGEVRSSMSEHDLASTRRHLDEAAAKAQTPEERAEIARLRALLGHLEEFWAAMSRAVARLEAAEMLPIGETFIAVVENSPEELMVKVEGRLLTYAIHRMPSRLVQTLIDRKLAKDPATNVLVGAYLAVDPSGDPKRARQLWEQASQQGIDLDDLMPELDYWTQAAAERSRRKSQEPTRRTTGRTPRGRGRP